MRRTLLAGLAIVGLVAIVAVGLAQTHGSTAAPRSAAASPQGARAALAGSPPALAALHAQAGALIDLPLAGVRSRLAGLRGFPYVVNKWASWCAPCRAEFPFFQRASLALGRRMGFVGLNGADNADDARRFLRAFPVPYPSFSDPSEAIARALGIGSFYPATLFVDARGRVAYIHQGGYASERPLLADIARYLGVRPA